MTQEKLGYIDMHKELNFEPNDSACSTFLSLFNLSEELAYHLLWAKCYLDVLYTEGNLDKVISDYLSRRASASPAQIEGARDTIEGILIRLAKDF